MIIFNEVKRLSETSDEAFTCFYNIMSRKDIDAKDVLYICSTSQKADGLFSEIAYDYLSEKINKNKRYIELQNGTRIWVKPIMTLHPWLSGKKFKNIIFER